jgi:dTDP-4-amino-4,6-dideoxygalactose transaminase
MNDPLGSNSPGPWPLATPEVVAAVLAALRDGSWGRYDGPHGEQLCRQLGELHGVDFVYACASGTFAVELALRALGVEPGSEVVLAAYDFPGNFRCIEAAGAIPVLVDIESPTWCLDAEQFAEACASGRVRAVIVSHLHGGLADMQRICEIANRHQIAVVEDACQATAAHVQGRVAGTWGHIGVLSFGGSKLLTAGRGGALLTRSAESFQRAKIFCERGNHAFPLSELQAAVLSPQITLLAEQNRRRLDNVARLRAALDDVPELVPVSVLERGTPSYYKHAWRLAAADTHKRDMFLGHAQRLGLEIGAGFKGFGRRSARRCRRVGTLENSARAAEQTILLHHPVLLGPPAAIRCTADNVRRAAQSTLSDD